MAKNEDKDWIDQATALAERIGMNPVRVRWKLTKWRDQLARSGDRLSGRMKQVRYKHRVCQACGNLQDREQKRCEHCGAKFLPPFLETLRRCGLFVPELLTVTSVLLTLIIFQYGRSVVYGGGDIVTPGTTSLIHFGANFPPAFWRGEWWRISTYMFLHGGAMHIIFNLLALKQIGPAVEEIFGRGRTLFFYMLTGILAGLGSAWFRDSGVGIGASGAIMGLVGLAAGWGQRDGGLAGRTARDMMLQWGLYTLVFGFLVGADNVAHFVGFAAGFAFGYGARPIRDKKLSPVIAFSEDILGILLLLATVGLANFPPKSLFDYKPATVSKVNILACGETQTLAQEFEEAPLGSDEKPMKQGDFGYPTFLGNCDKVIAKLGTKIGLQVELEGNPPDGLAYLLIRVTHPPLSNPDENEPITTDEWVRRFDLYFPRYLGWKFESPWELVPGDYTFQILDSDEEGNDFVLAEKTIQVELAAENSAERTESPTEPAQASSSVIAHE